LLVDVGKLHSHIYALGSPFLGYDSNLRSGLSIIYVIKLTSKISIVSTI